MKKEQAVKGPQVFPFCIVNVNSAVVFEHFEDLKDLIILNILKEKYLASWAFFILKLYEVFQTALCK